MTNKRKRLSKLIWAFLLIFIAGAAFAFSPGRLTIGGTVNIEPNYVIWNSATTTTVVSGSALGTTSNGITSTAEIQEARGRKAQNIEWEITFSSPGTATLDVSALNEHESLPASVSMNVIGTQINWNAFGLTVGGNYTLPPETIAPGNVGLHRYIDVTWDGHVPDGFNQDLDNPAFTFTVTFDYTVANE